VVLVGLAYLLAELLLPAWPCFYPHWAAEVALTQRRIREVEDGAYGFRLTHGHYPMGLAQLIESSARFVPDYTYEDGWGERLIYNLPGRVNTHAFDLFSKGRNRLDDGGRDDDINNWSEPEPLYYGEDHHRGWLSSVIFDVTAAFLLGWLLWNLLRWRQLYLPPLRQRRPRLRGVPLPRWLGPALTTVLATATFLYYPRLKTEYYYWRWTYLLPRPPGGPHTDVDDAAETLIYLGPAAAPVVAAKLAHQSLSGFLKFSQREETVRLLGLMGDPSVVPTLREFLLRSPEDPHYVRHVVVAQALRRLGDRSAVWLLLEDITGQRFVTTFWSAKALELLTWQNFGDLRPELTPEEARRRVELWREWWRQNQEAEESEWLRQGVEQALGQLTSDDIYLRASALRRLRRVTGMDFFCEYYMSLADRQQAAEVWRRWWQEHQSRFAHADFDTIDRRFRTVASLYLLEW